jgi:hypothetical protein
MNSLLVLLRPVTWLTALLLAASLPAVSRASVPWGPGGGRGPAPSARSRSVAPHALQAAGGSRQTVLQVRGSS